MKLLLLLLSITATAKDIAISFATSKARGTVATKELDKLVREAGEMLSLCCQDFGLRCQDRFNYTFQDMRLDTGGLTTSEVLSRVVTKIHGENKVLLGGYSYRLGVGSVHGAVLFKKADGVVLAHELGHVKGLRHAANPSDLMAPGEIIAFDPKPSRVWCERIAR